MKVIARGVLSNPQVLIAAGVWPTVVVSNLAVFTEMTGKSLAIKG